MAVCSLLLLSLASANAAQPGSAARQARDEAIRSLPLAKLGPDEREKVLHVVNDASLFRRLPTQAIECDPDYFAFLVEHPDVIVNIWSVLGVSDVKLLHAGDHKFDADDGAGTRGKVEFLYRNPETYLLYGEGIYDGKLLARAVRGRCVLLLRTARLQQKTGEYFITCRLDAFMQLDNVGVEILAKTFQPLMGPIADHNFRETSGFVESLYHAAEANYTGLQELTDKLALVDVKTRDQFAELSEQIAVKAALTQTATKPRPASKKPDTARRDKPIGTSAPR